MAHQLCVVVVSSVNGADVQGHLCEMSVLVG